MAGAVRRLLATLAARIDRVADREPDPDALTGRLSSRRHGRPAALAPEEVRALETPPEKARPDRSTDDRTPEEALQALDELRADQHRRMRGRRARPGG